MRWIDGSFFVRHGLVLDVRVGNDICLGAVCGQRYLMMVSLDRKAPNRT